MDLPSETSSDESAKSSDEKRKHRCTYKGCTASFSKNSKLVYHIRRHTGERPFVCDEPNCNKTYLFSFHLRRHKEIHHGNPHTERITCTHEGCYLELANKYSLKKHLKLKHNPDRHYPFNCDQCKQGFHRKKYLLQHSYVHTGLLPFICEVCETGFRTIRDRNRHKRTHTRHPCDCGEKFERWSTLLEHKKICRAPRPKCDNCNKTFYQAASLKDHLDLKICKRIQTFSCGYENCTRSYTYKKNLIYHINKCHKNISLPRIACTHEGCEKTFSKMQNLKLHVSRYHSGDQVKRTKKRREPRKDKGKSRTSAAALLAGLPLPAETHLALLKGKSIELPQAADGVILNTPSCNLDENIECPDTAEKNLTIIEQGEGMDHEAKLKEACNLEENLVLANTGEKNLTVVEQEEEMENVAKLKETCNLEDDVVVADTGEKKITVLAQVEEVKAKSKEALIEHLGGSKTIHTDRHNNDNENSNNYIKVL